MRLCSTFSVALLAAVACRPAATDPAALPGLEVVAAEELPSGCVAGEPGVLVDGVWHSASLQAALDEAPAGAVVTACEWTWLGPFTAPRAVTLEGPAILEGYGSGAVLTVPAGSTVRGLTLRGGDLGGLRLDQPGTYTVDGCTVEGNAGGGIVVGSGATVAIAGTIVRDNAADVGGGLFVGEGSTVVLSDDSVISGNRADTRGGGVALAGGSLVGGEISGNEAGLRGGGVDAVGDGAVDGAIVAGNRSPDGVGGGLSCVDGVLTLDGTEIRGNVAANGGGIWAEGCTLTGGLVAENEAVDDAGGVLLVSASLADARVTANVAGSYPSGVWLADAAALRDTVVDGHGGDHGAVEVGPNSTIQRSAIVDNATCAVLVSGQILLDGSVLHRNAAGACLIGGFNPTARLHSVDTDWGRGADDNVLDLSWSGGEYADYGADETFTCADGCVPSN